MVRVVNNKTMFEDDKKPAKKRKATRKSTSDVTVKIIPDVLKKALHVVTKSETEKEMTFYVFDMEGTMIMNYKMKGGERKTISGLNKGLYVYHVFCDDEQVATGKLEFR